MGYDRGDSFSIDFEPNEYPFGSKSKEKLSPLSYPIQSERNWKYSFLSEAQILEGFLSLLLATWILNFALLQTVIFVPDNFQTFLREYLLYHCYTTSSKKIPWLTVSYAFLSSEDTDTIKCFLFKALCTLYILNYRGDCVVTGLPFS